MSKYKMTLSKESFKFSCSHFTIFGPGEAERMHGHNYFLSVELVIQDVNPQLGMAFDFNQLKPRIKDVCDRLDEQILIPEESPFLQIQSSSGEVTIHFAKKRYVLPAEDVLLLPLVNISTEELARYVCIEISQAAQSIKEVQDLTVTIEETPGQRIGYTHSP